MLTIAIIVAGVLAVLLLIFVYGCCAAASRADRAAEQLGKKQPWPKWDASA